MISTVLLHNAIMKNSVEKHGIKYFILNYKLIFFCTVIVNFIHIQIRLFLSIFGMYDKKYKYIYIYVCVYIYTYIVETLNVFFFCNCDTLI